MALYITNLDISCSRPHQLDSNVSEQIHG